ncbi:U-box domain-containing protein 3, partial [Ananas comosus]
MCQNPNPSSSPTPNSNPSANPSPNPNPNPSERGEPKKPAEVHDVARRLSAGDAAARVEAAREVRRLARASSRARSAFAVAAVVEPLVAMLPSPDPAAREAALLALLNLAVEQFLYSQASKYLNKDTIVRIGALPHLVNLLGSENNSLRELVTAAVLTLSASPSNKPAIATSGAIPLLANILRSGTIQGKVDAVTTLYNLSDCEDISVTLPIEAVKPLLTLLKDCKKYSKFAEKATALLEILSKSEGETELFTEFDEGILTLVETVEDGSLLSAEYAVGVLLSLCRNCGEKYRELILNEGPIPGLLLLSIEGTEKARERAHDLLDLLRDPPRKRTSEELRNIVCHIASRVDPGPTKAAATSKRLLQDMIKRNMELTPGYPVVVGMVVGLGPHLHGPRPPLLRHIGSGYRSDSVNLTHFLHHIMPETSGSSPTLLLSLSSHHLVSTTFLVAVAPTVNGRCCCPYRQWSLL